jgi:hypothetical protein
MLKFEVTHPDCRAICTEIKCKQCIRQPHYEVDIFYQDHFNLKEGILMFEVPYPKCQETCDNTKFCGACARNPILVVAGIYKDYYTGKGIVHDIPGEGQPLPNNGD